MFQLLKQSKQSIRKIQYTYIKSCQQYRRVAQYGTWWLCDSTHSARATTTLLLPPPGLEDVQFAFLLKLQYCPTDGSTIWWVCNKMASTTRMLWVSLHLLCSKIHMLWVLLRLLCSKTHNMCSKCFCLCVMLWHKNHNMAQRQILLEHTRRHFIFSEISFKQSTSQWCKLSIRQKKFPVPEDV
jgi:hypothetical protein